ncbi:TIGR03564 family F420-dependent LLM class oxidoreductase [Pseudonocardia acaciae]|uniref:TIGR03564 family F420-dependent LLM class oxidoreductase n=1 Tax=Pseudonocardia acaciae TaxID=551276 RepID=UPI001FE0CB67|nr:TIGR03564 family F420-dependent LLM class oxidoreductase [Pseudonocardia acaciae]
MLATDMQIGTVFPQQPSGAPEPSNFVDATIEQGRLAHELGVRSAWFGQLMSYDSPALATLVGREVPGLTVGSSAVPIIGRHPVLLAAQARTAQAATAGRFQLGIALGAGSFLDPLLGTTTSRPIAHLREFLTALGPLLRTGEVDYAGELVTARTPWPSDLPGAQPPPPVLVAAMGPQALRVTGELADGALPFLAGPKTLAEHLVPTLTKAASAAGRPAPRVVAFVPATVTSRPDEVRAGAYEQLAFYESIPSYRAVLDRDGVVRAGDLALVGSPDQVADGLRRYADAGATEIVLSQAGPASADDQRRTFELIGKLSQAL